MDLNRIDRRRQFTNKLRDREVCACYPAWVVALHRIEYEIGPVDPNEMQSRLDDAKELDFSVPYASPVHFETNQDKGPRVIIIGAGPAGLSVAASLRRKHVPCIVLEEQETGYGSWDRHFSGLEVTTQRKWCHLPGFPMSANDFPNSQVSAKDYLRYLDLYSTHFGLDIRRGNRVVGIERDKTTGLWTASTSDDTIFASPLIVICTGKNRKPRVDTSLLTKLESNGFRVLHSTQLNTEVSWSVAETSGRNGKPCAVGLGNSASDIVTQLMKNTAEPIHLSTRTVHPVVPRSLFGVNVDTYGSFLRQFPGFVQQFVFHFLKAYVLKGAVKVDSCFPTKLRRWKGLGGRVPTIDKSGALTKAAIEQRLIGHGPIRDVKKLAGGAALVFDDSRNTAPVEVDSVILCTGYTPDTTLPQR